LGVGGGGSSQSLLLRIDRFSKHLKESELTSYLRIIRKRGGL
jgi:hypothetical protein